MNKIEKEVSLQEIKDVNKFNKKGENISARSVKFVSNSKEVVLTFKGEIAELFSKSDRGIKADLTLNTDTKQKKIM